MLFCPHPQPLSHKVGEGGRVVLPSPPAPLLRSAPTLWSAEALASASGGNFASALHIPLACVREGACCFALTPSPSPTLWERGVGARHAAPSASSGSFASALHIPLACVREGACCFALTPRPSPTLWERGVGARHAAPSASGGSFASALHIPLARLWERGARGVRVKRKMRPEESRRSLLTYGSGGCGTPHPSHRLQGLVRAAAAQRQQTHQTRTERNHARRLRNNGEASF